MDAATLFARLQLGPDASASDVRRAYARELKKIDQETQAQAFQELRETYEQLMFWVQRRSVQVPAPQAMQAVQPVQPTEPGVLQPMQSMQLPLPVPNAEKVDPDASRRQAMQKEPAAQGREPQAQPFPQQMAPEALGREVLEALVQRMQQRPFADAEDAADFVAHCLQDRRLENLDARRYFEWGIASILASGWRPGHEFLFGCAMDCFGWREDRSGLMALGHAGFAIDAAVTELLAFDRQPARQQVQQRDAIRALRNQNRPSHTQLIKWLPAAEYVLGTFPNWLHVTARPQALADWRRWDDEIPRWRIAAVFGFLIVVVLSALLQLATQSSASPVPRSTARLDNTPFPSVPRGSSIAAPGDGLASASNAWAARVAQSVRQNIVFTLDVQGNPQAEVVVWLKPNGFIENAVLEKSSGVSAWDEAVLRALYKTERLPLDAEGRVPSRLHLQFRPKGDRSEPSPVQAQQILTPPGVPFVAETRTDESIQRTFDKYKVRLYRAYQAASKQRPDLAGKVLLRITVNAAGQALSCEAVAAKSSLTDPALIDGIQRAVLAMDFGQVREPRDFTFLFPVEFLPPRETDH